MKKNEEQWRCGQFGSKTLLIPAEMLRDDPTAQSVSGKPCLAAAFVEKAIRNRLRSREV